MGDFSSSPPSASNTSSTGLPDVMLGDRQQPLAIYTSAITNCRHCGIANMRWWEDGREKKEKQKSTPMQNVLQHIFVRFVLSFEQFPFFSTPRLCLCKATILCMKTNHDYLHNEFSAISLLLARQLSHREMFAAILCYSFSGNLKWIWIISFLVRLLYAWKRGQFENVLPHDFLRFPSLWEIWQWPCRKSLWVRLNLITKTSSREWLRLNGGKLESNKLKINDWFGQKGLENCREREKQAKELHWLVGWDW